MAITISGSAGIEIGGIAVATVDQLSGPFNARTVITATDTSWPVPTLADPIVRVTCIGGGGGGGGVVSNGGTGGTTTFNAGTAGTISAAGGLGGRGSSESNKPDSTLGFASGNGGVGASYNDGVVNLEHASSGRGGVVSVGYLDLSGVSTVNVTIGAGGTAGSAYFTWISKAGGRGEVIVEYRAG
jgi:hypothetical protein